MTPAQVRLARQIVANPDYHWNRLRFFAEEMARDINTRLASNYYRLNRKVNYHYRKALEDTYKRTQE